MKIRTGFVSNSSTSSFTLITTKEISDKVLSEMPLFFRNWFIRNTKYFTFLDKDIIVFERIYGESFTSPDIYEVKVPKEQRPSWAGKGKWDRQCAGGYVDDLLREYEDKVINISGGKDIINLKNHF